ncbi:MAG: cation transporter [Phycisphaerae bacterium]|nr:cation transporter [Phycisphaerae bacterium]
MLSTERNREQAEVRRRIRTIQIAIGASLLVCAVELSLGGVLGLESLIAEGVHTLLDAVDSVIVLVAVYFAAKPADRSHQFGHGKYEALGAIIEASFIVVAAFGIAYRALDRLVHGIVPDQIPPFVCVVMGAAAVFYVVVSMYLMREARQTKSPAILAEALHLRAHIYITAAIGAGLLIGMLVDWPAADTVLAIGVALCLLVISWHIFREVMRQFTDAALPEDEIKTLGEIVARHADRFVEVHGLRTRQSGAEQHIVMHLVVKSDTTVAAAHALSHRIEKAIVEQWPSAKTTIHIEPAGAAEADQGCGDHGVSKVRTDEVSPDEREFIH